MSSFWDMPCKLFPLWRTAVGQGRLWCNLNVYLYLNSTLLIKSGNRALKHLEHEIFYQCVDTNYGSVITPAVLTFLTFSKLSRFQKNLAFFPSDNTNLSRHITENRCIDPNFSLANWHLPPPSPIPNYESNNIFNVSKELNAKDAFKFTIFMIYIPSASHSNSHPPSMRWRYVACVWT